MDDKFSKFLQMDLGTTRPTSVENQDVEVELSANDMVGNYAKAFVNECYRLNPLRMEQIDKDGKFQDELVEYVNYLFAKRIECVNSECKDWRKLKNLWIPSFVQYVLSQVGLVELRDYGITIKPVMKEECHMTLEEAYQVSAKIKMFQNELQMVEDAMPRSKYGNVDVMSCALIGDYVRSMKVVDHVSSTYVAAFANMQLRKESAFEALYRVQYDDIGYIASALSLQDGLF